MSIVTRCTCILLLLLAGVSVLGQDKKPDKKPATSKADQASSRKAVGYYADAANFQNNGAFPLAIDEWKKLLKEFPKDPLASKSWHYLGVCYMQLEKPDYESAEKAFAEALKDAKLDVREESLLQLNWCLF